MTTSDTPPKRAQAVRLEDLGLDLDALSMSELDAARLNRPQREARLDALMAESEAILRAAIDRMVLNTMDGKNGAPKSFRLAGVVGMFSGGNDSTVTVHLVHRLGLLTHTGHANTGVGIEETRQYVRDTSAAVMGVPLLERGAKRAEDQYEALVMDKGFPGYGRHNIVQQRLKGRAFREIRAALVRNPYRERVVFVAGRRRKESEQRTDVPELERIGSTVWVSPLVNWTKTDMNTYRARYNVPRNEVADLCHMSGECLCGCYARPGERAEVSQWYPRAYDGIAALEARLAGPEGDHLPAHVKTHGWANDPNVVKPPRALRRRKVRPSAANVCSSCAATHDAELQHPIISVPA